jgi:hypothetical protein
MNFSLYGFHTPDCLCLIPTIIFSFNDVGGFEVDAQFLVWGFGMCFGEYGDEEES